MYVPHVFASPKHKVRLDLDFRKTCSHSSHGLQTSLENAVPLTLPRTCVVLRQLRSRVARGGIAAVLHAECCSKALKNPPTVTFGIATNWQTRPPLCQFSTPT